MYSTFPCKLHAASESESLAHAIFLQAITRISEAHSASVDLRAGCATTCVHPEILTGTLTI